MAEQEVPIRIVLEHTALNHGNRCLDHVEGRARTAECEVERVLVAVYDLVDEIRALVVEAGQDQGTPASALVDHHLAGFELRAGLERDPEYLREYLESFLAPIVDVWPE